MCFGWLSSVGFSCSENFLGSGSRNEGTIPNTLKGNQTVVHNDFGREISCRAYGNTEVTKKTSNFSLLMHSEIK